MEMHGGITLHGRLHNLVVDTCFPLQSVTALLVVVHFVDSKDYPGLLQFLNMV